MVSLIDDSKKLSHYAKAIMVFTNITITDDDLPRKMCSMCLFLLKQTIIFKQKCESTDKQMKKLKKMSKSLESLKETVVQHWMYKLYFPNEFECKTNQENKPKSQKLERTPILKSVESSKQNKIQEDIVSNNFNHSCIKDENNKDDPDHLLDIIENIFTTQDGAIQDFKNPKKKKLKRKLLKYNQPMNKKSNASVTLDCKLCNKVLANPMTYKQHMQRHTGCHYICEHCGKGFPVRAELNIHRVSIHGTGPYLQCQHCPFKAPRKFDLIEHVRVHTGERPYTCDKCGLTFRRRGIWKRHMIYHNEKNVQCTQCPRKFYQRSAMLAHANNVHDRLYVYLCNKCGVTYAKPATVRRHLTERHGIPREMQGKVLRVNKASSFNTLGEYNSICLGEIHT
ncbi:zinc finger protein 587-like [Papilio machaon]|uniref:zinc finger protein 587-like n=1 Tax=Papilio machaon TaxID=76193 RepID=UPI001E6649A8|nr:zinc finger protein 587-like [Papilio machaon]